MRQSLLRTMMSAIGECGWGWEYAPSLATFQPGDTKHQRRILFGLHVLKAARLADGDLERTADILADAGVAASQCR